MAARVAAGAGANVVVFERQSWAGGRLGLQTQPLQGPRSIFGGLNGVEFCRGLLDEATSAGARMMLATEAVEVRRVSSAESPFEVGYSRATGGSTVAAGAVVVSTGSCEPMETFPGSDLRGVMLSGEAQEMLTLRGVLPGRRFVMVGSDNAGLLIAAALRGAGAEVLAVVDGSPEVLGREANVAPLREAGVAVLTSSMVVAAHGAQAVEWVTVGRMDDEGGLLTGTERSFEVDTLCLAGPRIPDPWLATQCGCPSVAFEVMGGATPVHDRRMATPVAGLYVCGDAAGVESGAASLEAGRLAGLWAAREAGYRHPHMDADLRLARARLGYLRRGARGLLRRRAKAALSAEYDRLAAARPPAG